MTETTGAGFMAFQGRTRIAVGPITEVAVAAGQAQERDETRPVLIFEAASGRPIDLDLRGSAEDIRRRLTPPEAASPAPRGRGRPKLGVTAREITLLPRHWDWLAAQPGGASVTIRKLVEQARLVGGGKARRRQAQEAAYRFMSAMAGDEPGFEEASRALFASDGNRFGVLTEPWPADVRDQARRMAADAFIPET
jgi:hypothetical protein